MPTQAEINAGQTGAARDTAAAKAKQGGGQAAKDTAAAKAKQNNNNQAAKDTAAAKSKQNGGDGGTAGRMAEREAAAGLNLAGNDTMSGRGGVDPTFSQREASAGLRLAGNNTTSGRDEFYSKPRAPRAPWSSFDSEQTRAGSPMDFMADVAAGGGGGLAGMEIIWKDQSTTFVSAADMNFNYDGEDYWSLVLAVSSGSFTKVLAYDATEDIFETSGTAPNIVQDKYRFRLVTSYIDDDNDFVQTPISAYGQYREVIICVNGQARTILMKVT